MSPNVESESTSGLYRVSRDEPIAALERRRLLEMAELLDATTRARIEALGLAPGWRCLEVGPGAGTISRWLGERVGPEGEVVSLDLDLRFHVETKPPVALVEADLMAAPLPRDHFQVAHARNVIEHLPDPLAALARLVDVLEPGGWLLIEDGDFVTIDEAPLPEAFRALHDAATAAGLRRSPHWKRRYGSRMRADLMQLSLEDVAVDETRRTLVGGTPGAESYLLGLEYAVPGLVAGGLIEAKVAEEALALARRSDFSLPGPVHVIGVGRKPLR